MEKFVNCCVIYDNSGNPIDIVESKTITETAFKDLKKKVALNKKEIAQAKSDKEKELLEKEIKEQAKQDKHTILLAYLMFNEIVERGKANTTNEFEEMFACWLVGKCEIAIELCPKEYLDILERLGLDYGRN